MQTLKGALDAWRKRRLHELDVAYLYLDAIAIRIRQAGRVASTPVLVAVAVLTDGTKQLVSLEMCGSEAQAAWKGFLDDLVARGLAPPRLCIVDGCLRDIHGRGTIQRDQGLATPAEDGGYQS